jgi:16S rRNA (guanine527-N7)-methyltransferase
MEKTNLDLLAEGAKAFGLLLSEATLNAFDLYLGELVKWNRKINLTAIRTEREIVVKHFLDSLSVFPLLTDISALLDIGSGAGFPGIPLRLVEPSLSVTLVDGVLKKVDFQKHIIRSLRLQGIETVHGRVEDGAIRKGREEKYDGAVSRAFSDLGTFLGLASPYLRSGGVAIAMKGEVLREDERRQDDSRYRLERRVDLILPSSDFRRSIMIYRKH